MKNFYAYVYHDPERNVPIYVGKGYGNRAYDHLKYSKKNHRFRNRLKVLKRKGLEPRIQILNVESEELAFLVEVELIALYGRKDLGKGPLYNMTDGGDGCSGSIHSEETKRKLAASVKASYTPELRAFRSKVFSERIVSQEVKDNQAKRTKGWAHMTLEIRQKTRADLINRQSAKRGELHFASKRWTLQSPGGVTYVTKDMTTFCAEHKLNYSSLRNRAREQSLVPLTKGESKGWVVISCV